jgi:hypothetical protein
MTSAVAPKAVPSLAHGRAPAAAAPQPNEPEKLARNNDLPAAARVIWRCNRRAGAVAFRPSGRL